VDRSTPLVVLMGAMALVAAPLASAQDKLTVAGYGGSFEQTMRKQVIPVFEAAHKVKIEYVAGNSTDTLAKLQAQRANQAIDVAILDDGPMYQALELGFCTRIAALPADDLYEGARFKDDKAVALGLVGTGLMYNTKVFKQKGWAAPTSWNDLKDAKYKGAMVLHPIHGTYGLHTLIMFARLNGGGEKNIEPGFKVMRTEVNPQVLAYEPSPSKMTELFQSGQASIAVWGSARVQAFADTGFPVDFVYPKEGTVKLLVTACPIAKANASPLASKFIESMVEPAMQLTFLKDHTFGPASRKVDVTPELAGMMPVGERAAQLIEVDWDTINARRAEWTKRWNREIER
jgi:putative spermidine/putrescine transport system substrate-binding protein